MKILSCLIFLLIFSSCSNQTIRRGIASEEAPKVEDDFNWVDSLNFDKKTETKYKAEEDEFKTKEIDEKSNILVKESIAAFTSARLDEQLKESDDVLSKIIIRCNQGKFEEAFQFIDQAYSQFKNNTSYWNQVGSCYYLKGDYSKAILFYNKSRDLDSKFSPPVNNLGVVFQKQGRFQKALLAYKKASEMNAFSVTPSFNMARLYLQFGLIKKAQPILSGLIKKSSSDPQLINAMASIKLIQGDLQNSLNYFKSLSTEYLNKPEYGLNYALCLKLLNRQEDAQSSFSKISESSGDMKIYANKVEKFIKE